MCVTPKRLVGGGIASNWPRRKFLGVASVAGVCGAARLCAAPRDGLLTGDNVRGPDPGSRIVDMHVHFDEKNPKYIDDFLRVSDRLNVTALMHTPFANRKAVVEAAKKHPTQIVPSGYIDMDAPDVVKQVQELHGLGYRGLGELEFVKKPYNDPSYFPIYELANEYGWIVMFHTGIVLREKFTEPENVASVECGQFIWRK